MVVVEGMFAVHGCLIGFANASRRKDVSPWCGGNRGARETRLGVRVRMVRTATGGGVVSALLARGIERVEEETSILRCVDRQEGDEMRVESEGLSIGITTGARGTGLVCKRWREGTIGSD